MKLAVTGATGQLGRLVLAALKARAAGADIAALVRSPEKAAGLASDVRAFDYDQPSETLVPALTGVDVLLLISGSEIGQRIRQHQAVIDAAAKAGVGHIVYTSLLHAPESSLSLAQEHLATEQALAKSGIAHTLLRNGWYSENYLGALPAAIAHKALIGAAGSGRISGAARADYAEAAARVLLDPTLWGKTYELAGDDAFTLKDLAAELSRQTGDEIPYINMSEADYAQALVGAGLPEPLAQAIAGFDVAAAGGALENDGKTLSNLIERPTTPLADLIAKALTA